MGTNDAQVRKKTPTLTLTLTLTLSNCLGDDPTLYSFKVHEIFVVKARVSASLMDQ